MDLVSPVPRRLRMPLPMLIAAWQDEQQDAVEQRHPKPNLVRDYYRPGGR
jgi:hypothetical protein